MLAFSLDRNKMVFGSGGVGGNVIELNIEVADEFYKIAKRL